MPDKMMSGPNETQPGTVDGALFKSAQTLNPEARNSKPQTLNPEP